MAQSNLSVRIDEQDKKQNDNMIIQNDNDNDLDKNESVNPLAVTGVVCSIVGISRFDIVMGLLAIVFGAIAKKRIKVLKKEKGEGLATAALIIGIIDIVFSILYIFGMMVAIFNRKT